MRRPGPSAHDLERLRRSRIAPERDLTLRTPLGFLGQDLKKRARQTGGLGGAWAALVPPDLAAHTTLVSLSRGVLTIKCDDASAKFDLDRWLRTGGEIALVKCAPAGLTKVRLVL